MNAVFTKMWHQLAGFDSEANSTWRELSYYTVLHRPGLRILSINSNYDWSVYSCFYMIKLNPCIGYVY